MCESGRGPRSFVCGDAARKHLFPLPFSVTEDGSETLDFEETTRAKVAGRLHEIAAMGLCGAQIDDLDSVREAVEPGT